MFITITQGDIPKKKFTHLKNGTCFCFSLKSARKGDVFMKTSPVSYRLISDDPNEPIKSCSIECDLIPLKIKQIVFEIDK